MGAKGRASERWKGREKERRKCVPTGSLGSCNWKCNFDAEYTRKSPRKLKERGYSHGSYYEWPLLQRPGNCNCQESEGTGGGRNEGNGTTGRSPGGHQVKQVLTYAVALDARYISINCCIKYKSSLRRLYAPVSGRRVQASVSGGLLAYSHLGKEAALPLHPGR